MFTGIVEAFGTLARITPTEGGVAIDIEAPGLDLGDVKPGDSIAVNGVCLTAVDVNVGTFRVDVSAETLRCTTGFPQGGEVNLEKALRAGDRLGGHMVSGHVDGVGTVVRFDAIGDNRLLEIDAPADLAKYIARKGSVTINGVSLTVNSIEGARFTINLIPHTIAVTTLKHLKAGAGVNLEIDLIARYVERLLSTSS